MTVKVADSIMGSGKTLAAIHHMNTHPDKKFIFITPYLTEATRIRQACPDLNFVEPSAKIEEYAFRKTDHIAALIKEGRNISSTHEAFKNCTDEMLRDIQDMGYTLIIDESINMLESFKVKTINIENLEKLGFIVRDDDKYRITEEGAASIEHRPWGGDFLDFVRSYSPEVMTDTSQKQLELFYWMYPTEMITSFSEVYILTYMFEAQDIFFMLRSYGIPFEYIGVYREGDRDYRFGPYTDSVPGYVYNIKNMIHILDHPRLNDVGDERCALSMNWFKTPSHTEEVEQLKNNIYNYFRNIKGDAPTTERMWATYRSAKLKLSGRGYAKSFTNFNERATNVYKHKTCLAYAANVFFNTGERIYYNNHGVEVDDDLYALSTMVQWIWRSAIRVGQPIDLYLPSKRMRGLLMNWMNNLSRGKQHVG